MIVSPWTVMRSYGVAALKLPSHIHIPVINLHTEEETRLPAPEIPREVRARANQEILKKRKEEAKAQQVIGRAKSAEILTDDERERLARALHRTYYRDNLAAAPAGWSLRAGEVLERGETARGPGYAPFNSIDCEAELLEHIRGVLRGDNLICGAYHLARLSKGDMTGTRLTIDIDGKTPEQAIQAEIDVYALTTFLLRNFPEKCWLLDLSKSGRGYHICIFFDRPIPAHAMHRFAAFLIEMSRMPKETEVYPKQRDLTDKGTGSQVAIPGSMYWFAKTGGSVLLDRVTRDPIPHREWADHLDAMTPLCVDDLERFMKSRDIDIMAPPPPVVRPPVNVVVTGEGVPDFFNSSDVYTFLRGLGVEADPPRTQTLKDGTRRDVMQILDCPWADEHISGHARRDGAAVMFYPGEDGKRGRVTFNCFHAGCACTEKEREDGKRPRSWGWYLQKLGFRTHREQTDGTPVISHRAGKRERAFLSKKARAFLHDLACKEYGSVRVTDADTREQDDRIRLRLKRVSACCNQNLQLVPMCVEGGHGDFEAMRWACERRAICPSCGTQYAIALEEFIENEAFFRLHGLHVIEIRTDFGLSVEEAFKQMRYRWKRVRKTIYPNSRDWRRAAYQVIEGLRRAAIVTTGIGADTMRKALAKAAKDEKSIEWVTVHSSVTELAPLARLVADVYTEPCLEVRAAAENQEYNRMVAVSEIYRHGHRRLVSNRNPDAAGFKIPWLSETEAGSQAAEDAKKNHPERSGRCPKDVVDTRTGEVRPCGCRITFEARCDHEVIARGKPGQPAWFVQQMAWGAMDARETLYAQGAANHQTAVA